jgi:lipid-A-disaccharide synthase
MVVGYRFAAGTVLLLRALRMFRLPYFSLPNLLAGEPLAPEFLQEAVQPEPMASALALLLDDAPRREYLLQRFHSIHESLRQDGAALAAAAVLQLLRERTREGLGH